ncbi:MAG TPA: hypothetical protein VGJ15_05240 [Pirellulales bacterium]|jgi:hypothetical protein
MSQANGNSNSPNDDNITDLPLLHSWPAVYAFVLGSFVLWVLLLTALSRAAV